MAAELTYKDGAAQMFYSKVGGTPWHDEGFALDESELFDFEAVVGKFFDYPLEKHPFVRPEDPGVPASPLVAGNTYYIWRPDIKKQLGKDLGGDYEIVTNREAFEVLKPLIDSRILRLETGGVLRDGADAWLMGMWDIEKFGPEVKDVFNRDGGILPYATVMVNHTGRRPVLLGNTSIRIVCANTMRAAETEAAGLQSQRWQSVTHDKRAKVNLVQAAQQVFTAVVDNFERIARQYKILMECRLEDEWFEKLVLDVAAPDPTKSPKFNPEAKLAELVKERADTKRREIRRMWTEGKGHAGNKSAWEALNGAIEVLDHNKKLYPNRGGTWRTASLLDGALAEIKDTVTDNLMAHAITLAI